MNREMASVLFGKLSTILVIQNKGSYISPDTT